MIGGFINYTRSVRVSLKEYIRVYIVTAKPLSCIPTAANYILYTVNTF